MTMTIPQDAEQRQLLLMDYLYGEMNATQRQAFEQAMAADSELAAMLKAEQRFDSSVPIGTQPLIDEQRLEGNSWLLRQNLQKATRPGLSLQAWWQDFTARPINVLMQGSAMAMTFALGVMVTGTGQPTQAPVAPATVALQPMPVAASPLQLISDEDYEIYRLQVNSYDAGTGEIDLSFSLASETRLTGNVADADVHQLMAVALQDDIDSAARLDTIQALQPVAANNNSVYEALINVLVSDQNPGVRYQAVQTLVALSDQEQVRDALRYALRSDVNQGVRVAAFEALSQYQDEQTLAVFRQQMDQDSNEYIRTQSRSILEALDVLEAPDSGIESSPIL